MTDIENKTENKNQYLLNFIDNEFKGLIQLYIKEREEKKLGILQVIGNKKDNKVDVMYIIYDDMKEELQKVIKDKENMCLFLVYDIETPDDFFITEHKL
tara:strand:- start:6311 stop:6607 length:297 start_codon:yes stop_codon:yes gene_type:complete